mgnify:CR=1 FL=1
MRSGASVTAPAPASGRSQVVSGVVVVLAVGAAVDVVAVVPGIAGSGGAVVVAGAGCLVLVLAGGAGGQDESRGEGGEAWAIQADVTRAADVAAMVAEAQARMLKDSVKHDYLGRDGEVIAPLSLEVR